MNRGINNKGNVLLLLFLMLAHFLAAGEPKTDTLTLYNGDRVTCAVKKLSLGKLQVKTGDLGTLNIKWYKIASIETKQILEIILIDRRKIYGILSKTDSLGYVKISSGIMIEEIVPIMKIVAINQIAKNFWQGLEGSVSYGLSYAKGTSNLQSNFAGNIKHRTNHWLNKIVLNSIISNNNEQISRKQDATYSLFYYFEKRTFLNLTAAWQQNTELGIDNRIITGMAYGVTTAESNFNLLKFSGGVIVNIEEDDQKNRNQALEGIITGSYDLYLFASPKISLTFTAVAFPGLTDWGRLRSEIDTQLSWEIFSDFTFGLSFYFNSDNNPSSSTASTTDWGSTTSIGYTF